VLLVLKENMKKLNILKMKNVKHIFLVLLFVHQITLFSQTYVSGSVSGSWAVAGSPYIVTGDIVVEASSTLAISPGVQVLFNGSYSLTVNGLLVAQGASNAEIIFDKSDDNPGYWNGIILNESNSNNIIANCKISHAQFPNYWDNTLPVRGGGISVYNTNLLLEESEISHCGLIEDLHLEGRQYKLNGGGLYVNKGKVDVVKCNFLENRAQNGGAIYYVSYVGSTYIKIINCDIAHNYVHDDGGGICFQTTRDIVEVTNCFIHNNESWDNLSDIAGGGVRVLKTLGVFDFKNNTVCMNNLITPAKKAYDFDYSPLILFDSTAKRDVNAVYYGDGIAIKVLSGSSNLDGFYNNIVFFNGETNNDNLYSNVSPTLYYSDIGPSITPLTYSNGCFNDDPLFSENYRLLQISPCKDAGYELSDYPLDDLDGKSRPIGDYYDMGAFEYGEDGFSIIVMAEDNICSGSSITFDVEGDAGLEIVEYAWDLVMAVIFRFQIPLFHIFSQIHLIKWIAI